MERNVSMHRKALVRLMNRPWAPCSQQARGGSRKSRYSREAKEQLAVLWNMMGFMCAERTKAALPEWIHFREHKDCPEAVKAEILKMSASTIVRFLEGERAALQRKLNTGTRRGVRRFVTKVPVRDLEHTPEVLGPCEIDCVAHCGGSLSGTFAWTLTDIASGWTECKAMFGKDGRLVRKALAKIEGRLPFKLLALYCDNGSKFLNQDVVEWFAIKDRIDPLKVFRSRPRRKNDQYYVEQKNYTHARKLFGYGRIDAQIGIDMMNSLYRKEWRQLQNFFMPQQKLLSKYRLGSKVKRSMSKPITPYERILGLDVVVKSALSKEKEIINPFSLRTNQKSKVRTLHP
ncbi:MAG: hypothetical protein H7249_16325 [Chitinophagaceae bacterium]|nr:hypothetical protein [Oligoflexus sp.]